MRIRLLVALALVPAAVGAPAALGQDPSPAPACTPAITEERAMAALQQALEDPLPPRAGQVVPVRVTPCGPGRLVLRVRRHDRNGPMLAEADRTLRSTATATMRLRTTKAVERYRGKRMRLHLKAIFLP